MEFRDSEADAEFRAQARAVLEGAVEQPVGDPVEQWRAFQRTLFDAGFAGLSWPREHGGRGATLTEQAIFLAEYDRAGAPDRLNTVGEGLAGPTLIDFGSDQQRRRFLEPILTGEEIWCRLFSEPGAGSDLAALETRAERKKDVWRISGHKVWASRARIASYGLLLARTGKSLTYFILPMDSAGLTIRPLRHLLGEPEYDEVLLEDVALPDWLRVGDVGDGWKLAQATLSYERVALATGGFNVPRLIGALIELVREDPALARDVALRRRVAGLWARAQVQQVNTVRALAALEQGTPGPETSIGKLYTTPLVQEIADLACELSGLAGQLDEGFELDRWLRLAYRARGAAIAGGTTFIQRNLVAEQVLGL